MSHEVTHPSCILSEGCSNLGVSWPMYSMYQLCCRVHGGDDDDDQEAKDQEKEDHYQANDEEGQALKSDTNKPLMNLEDHKVAMKVIKTAFVMIQFN